LEQIKGQTH